MKSRALKTQSNGIRKRMILVVESGSTKADWMLLPRGDRNSFSSKGFNPYFHDRKFILNELNNHAELSELSEVVREVYFYGAGCSNDEMRARIQAPLSEFFKNAKVYVYNDLEACAIACFAGKPQIACILGTGANSCFHDGNQLEKEVPALGYILGDEGSGSYFGKALIRDFLYKRLPQELNEEFEGAGLTKDLLFENVYRKPNANVYLASLAPILIRNKHLNYSQNLIRQGFQEFLDVHVKYFQNYRSCEVNFVGSIAGLLQDELRLVCSDNGINVGRIIHKPMDGLVAYYEQIKNPDNFKSSGSPNI